MPLSIVCASVFEFLQSLYVWYAKQNTDNMHNFCIQFLFPIMKMSSFHKYIDLNMIPGNPPRNRTMFMFGDRVRLLLIKVGQHKTAAASVDVKVPGS